MNIQTETPPPATPKQPPRSNSEGIFNFDKLFPFQKDAVRAMVRFLNKRSACYNACVPGLGKTIQTIVTLNYLASTNQLNPILIICPSVMRMTWAEEIRKWYVIQDCPILVVKTGSDIKKITTLKPHIIIVSYDLASKYAAKMPNQLLALVLDEAHYLKSPTAKRTKAILKQIYPTAKYRICLSGTPFTRSVADGYTLFSKICPDFFPDFHQFVGTYCYQRVTPWATEYYGVKNVEQLRKIMRENFYIRYTKEEVLKDLPPKTYQKIVLPMEYNVWTKDEESEIQKAFDKVLESGSVPDITSIAGLRRAQALKKLPAVIDFVKQLLDQEMPVVLFAYHKAVLQALIEALAEYKPLTLLAEHSPTQRQNVISEFQKKDADGNYVSEHNLFIGSMVAAGIGVTLTRSSTVVLAELDWSPSVIDQAVCRCHRIGTINPVTAYYFVVQDSIDENIAKRIVDKASTFASILEN